jgi:hypothetical protein
MAWVMAFQFMGRLIIHIHQRCLCLQHRRYTFNKTFRNKTTRKIRFSHNPAIGIIAGNRKVITLMSRIVPVTGYKSLHSRPNNVVFLPYTYSHEKVKIGVETKDSHFASRCLRWVVSDSNARPTD